MALSPVLTEPQPLTLTLNVKAIGLTDEQFYQLCGDNPELRLELTAERELVIVPPAGMKAGWRNSILVHRLVEWAKKDKKGVTFESSAGFALPNGAKRSPDAAWLSGERWKALTQEQREAFAPLCPEFVAEVRSPADSLPALREEMVEYIENGAQLGWLIDPFEKRVYVYRPGQPEQCLESLTTLPGAPVLSGFVFVVAEIW